LLPADMQQPVVSELLRVCVRHSTRTKEDARDAFDNDDDFAAAFGGFRSHLMTLIRALAALEPLFALQVAAEQLRAAIAYPASAPTAASVAAGVFNARGQVTMSHPQYVAYEAACALLEIVLKQAPPALWQTSGAGSSASGSVGGAASASGLPILEALLSQILSTPSAEPVLLGRQLYAIRLFIPLFQSNSAALSAALELLFASVTFTPPAEAVSPAALASGAAADVNAHLSDDTRATRRRACHSLIALAAAVPQHLLAVFQSLVQRVVQVAGMAETTDSERTSLFQFLVAARYRPAFNRTGG
jgi:hypothetical protein